MRRNTKILAYDPGLTMAGWSYILVDIPKGHIHAQRAGTICISQLIRKIKYEEECAVFSTRVVALGVLEKYLYDMAEKFKPDFISVEDAFYNPKMPNAYMALTQWITQLEQAMYRWRKPVYRIPSKQAKQHITTTGSSNKLGVIASLKKLPDLTINSKVQSLINNNNVADSIAVGYTFSKMALPELLDHKKGADS